MTLDTVHRKIQEINQAQQSHRPAIMVSSLSAELQCSRDQLLPFLVELKNMRLINFNESAKTSFKLTFLGLNSNM